MSNRKDMVVLIKKGIEPILFCVHPISGSSTIYRHMKKAIPNSIYGINAQGVQLESSPMQNVTEMAASYIEIMRDLQPTGPYNVCGYSMGGLIAYEIACQLLSEYNEQTEFVGLIDSQVNINATRNIDEEIDSPGYWLTFINIILGSIDKKFYEPTNEFWTFSKQEKLDYLAKIGKHPHQNTVRRVIDFEYTSLYYRFYCAMNKACLGFEPSEFGGNINYFATDEGVQNNSVKILSNIVSGNVSTTTLNGTHLELFSNHDYAHSVGKSISKFL